MLSGSLIMDIFAFIPLRLNWPEILSRDRFVIFQAREREPRTGKGKPPNRQNCRTNIKYPAGHHSLHPELNLLRLKSEGSVVHERLRRAFECFSD